jgi:Holliday junction resolvasome RuvABC DNA-binding subunit
MRMISKEQMVRLRDHQVLSKVQKIGEKGTKIILRSRLKKKVMYIARDEEF